MKIKLIFFVLLLVLSNSAIMANPVKLDSLIKEGIHQIYSLEFEKADTTFQRVRNNYPDHPAGKFFDAMILWWKILLDLDDEQYDDKFFNKLDETIEFCDGLLDENPENVEAIFFKGGALGFKGRLAAIRDDWLEAAANGREALPLVHRAHEIDSTNIDVQLGFGIYNYYAAVIPEEYPIVKPLMIFFPDGDKQKGIKQLELVADKGKYANYEAQYFLMGLYYNFENNFYKAENWVKKLVNEFPDNPRFQRYYGRIKVKQNNYPAAAEIFDSALQKYKEELRGYDSSVAREAHYYLGMDFKNNDNPDSALFHFNKCVKFSKKIDGDEDSGFYIYSQLHAGKMLERIGNKGEAEEKYQLVLDLREYKSSHELAEKYIKNLKNQNH